MQCFSPKTSGNLPYTLSIQLLLPNSTRINKQGNHLFIFERPGCHSFLWLSNCTQMLINCLYIALEHWRMWKALCKDVLVFQSSEKFTCNSSSVRFSPSSFATRFRFLNEIRPVSSSSNNRKAFRISSFVSFSAWKSASE